MTLQQKLNQLNLSTMSRQLETTLTEAATKSLSAAATLEWLTDMEIEARSQRAIERLGALREGILRAHRIRPDGSSRDTVTYSMVAPEWPAAKARLNERLVTGARLPR